MGKLPSNFERLLGIFEGSSGKPPETLVSELTRIEVPADLSSALVKAVGGDNRDMNRWLFEHGGRMEPLAWIAPVRAEEPTYAWMVGFPSPHGLLVCECFTHAHRATKDCPLLRQTAIPLPLLFVDPVAVSAVTARQGDAEPDEFAIFQVGYRNAPTEVSDLAQRMVINATHVAKKRQIVFDRFIAMGDMHPVVETLRSDAALFGLLHTEGHNQGHFVGAWPYEDEIKKRCVLYEAVEELRACLASVAIADQMPLNERAKDAYALGVFLTRFLGYGFEAWCLEEHRRETAREVSVALMLYEALRERGIVSVSGDGSDVRLKVDYQALRPALLEIFVSIDAAEAANTARDSDGLRETARVWYGKGFPNGGYSPDAVRVYTHLRG